MRASCPISWLKHWRSTSANSKPSRVAGRVRAEETSCMHRPLCNGYSDSAENDTRMETVFFDTFNLGFSSTISVVSRLLRLREHLNSDSARCLAFIGREI